MKAITAVGATPSRMAILYDILTEAGPEGEEREQLAALVGPASLARSEEAGEDNAFADCLSLGQDLDLFVADGDRVRLADTVAAEKCDTFIDFAERVMVDRAQTAEVTDGWVAGAVAWMLCQDPREPLPWGGSGAMTRLFQQTGNRQLYGMTNDSRFQQAVYWARALGFVTRLNLKGEVVVADPTLALHRRLDKIIAPGAEMTMNAFTTQLAAVCPVFDGGGVRAEVDAKFAERPDGAAVSTSLGLALHRAKQRGSLQFRSLSDAQVVFVPGLLGDGRVTHVSRPQVRR